MLMSYVLRSGLRGHNLDELSLDFLSHSTQKFSEVTTIEKKKVTFDYVDVEIAKNYAAEDSDVTFRLWEVLKLELIKNKLYEFYFYIEKPLIETIALMEINGCKINNNHLTKLSNEFSEKIEIIEEKFINYVVKSLMLVHLNSWEMFYFLSLIFRMEKREKWKFQTDVKVLEKLKSEKFSVANDILEWRQFSKLKSTYCEGLLSRESKKTNRIHTSFGMASTLTGRFSSNDPNLQNIPIKTAEGRKIRQAFISSPNHSLISIDYSQIELRILAEVANVHSLIEAFKKDEDIHSVTAIDVFQVTKDSVNSDLRRKAKTINFGIIYGISPYGLALQLDISNSEAKEYIENYFFEISWNKRIHDKDN